VQLKKCTVTKMRMKAEPCKAAEAGGACEGYGGWEGGGVTALYHLGQAYEQTLSGLPSCFSFPVGNLQSEVTQRSILRVGTWVAILSVAVVKFSKVEEGQQRRAGREGGGVGGGTEGWGPMEQCCLLLNINFKS